MCSGGYYEPKTSFNDFDYPWEEEIELLKDDIKKAEKKAKRSEHRRLIDKAEFCRDYNKSGDSLMDLCPSPRVQKPGEMRRERETRWVSPSVSKVRQVRREVFQDPFSGCPESSFDGGSSVISLDFGLVSPHRSWCSPPQRIERAQNREWSSPHRVIDRPNPENSPGNWISMKESRLPLRHSPALGVRSQPEAEVFPCPELGPRPPSQATYVLPEPMKPQESPPKVVQPTRKTSVLSDYEPERVVFAKARAGGSSDPSNEKIRRVVDSSGHVVKVSLLGDFEAPVFGKGHEKTGEGAEKENAEPSDKPTRSSKTTKISCKLSPSAALPQTKKLKKKEGTRTDVVEKAVKEADEKGDKEEAEGEDRPEDIGKTTQKVIADLEEILRPSNKDKATSVKEKSKEEKPKLKRPKPCPKAPEEKPMETPEKRKRNVDPKAVQEYIKNQKQKRLEQVKTEKKTKDAEKEARKKKLEELRIRTLKLATQSKKKKQCEPAVKAEEQVTEDDVTMSLGLKQTKPKVSYNESVSKLKKKGQQKPQTMQVESETVELPAEKSGDEDNAEKTLEEVETVATEEKPEPEIHLQKPEDVVETKTRSDLNETLKKLAESLHSKLEQKEKQLRSRTVSLASKSVRDPLSQVPSQESLKSVKSAPEETRPVVTVDLETIQTLKSDIKKISENFKVLHEIILDKAELSGKTTARKPSGRKPPVSCREEPREPEWLTSVGPRPYPYNVLTAFQQKMNLKMAKTPSSVSQCSSTFAEPISNKYDSEFEALSIPSDRLRSSKAIGKAASSEANYYSLKEDSGSELSSSILDSEKQSWRSLETRNRSRPPSTSADSRSSPASEISSSIHLATSRAVSSTRSKSSVRKMSSGREDLITPDIKLITSELHQDKFNDYARNLNVTHETCKIVEPEELNNSEKSCKEQKSDSTIAEIIDNLTENERSVKSTNEKAQNVAAGGGSLVRRSFFQPEMLHLQFQAELTLLETFQQSLSHFLEAERMKTISEVNKIVYEKAINTEKSVEREDQGVQTCQVRESADRSTSEGTESVKTEIAVEESGKTEKAESEKTGPISERSEKLGSSSGESLKSGKREQKDVGSPDSSNNHMGISFEMLNRMMKDEELRSEHQLALIRLREKTSSEKVKAELTFLEMKKRALKERGGDVEQNISAIKKKQRGILLKYQSEKEEIERLKKMHRIASEERKIMIKQQKQIQQMQMSTKDMIIKLKKRERSPSKKIPMKAKAPRSPDSQSEIPEDIAAVSDSALTESAEDGEESARQSSCTDLDVSSRSNVSEDEEETLRRNGRSFQSKISCSLENFKSKKSLLEVERYPRKRHSVEELLSWTRRLEERESHLKELEKQAMSAANRAKRLKSLKSGKTSMKDRSTSPFQFQDSGKTISEVSPSDGTEVLQKSSTISEAVESNVQTDVTKTEEPVVEKIQSSASEDIPEQFSKKVSTSRTTEYCSESFESPSSSETPKAKAELPRAKSLEGGRRGISIKLSLSPRMHSPRRRYSSGSDDSVNLSHTETASEQSDLESRIAALHEQLRKRKLEAERLRREQKKAQRERLKVKEQSLLKQIQAYDAYIQKKKQELEREYEHSTQKVMKPLIKQPKAAEKLSLKRQEVLTVGDSEKMLSYAKPESRIEEIAEKVVDSDSEVIEQVKETSESAKEESESIREQIESRTEELEEEEEEEEDKSGVVVSVLESSPKGSNGEVKSSLSESLPEENVSQSESEDQSISVKTTLHSPERDTERETIPTEAEEESQNKQSFDEEIYQLESFESDAEEVAAVSEKVANSAEASEVGTEIPSESAEIVEEGEEEEEKEKEGLEEEEEEEKEEEREEEAEVEEIEVSQTLVKEAEAEDDRKTEKAERIADSIIVGLILESLNVFCSKKAAAERKLAEESKLTLEALSSYLAREIISEAVDDMLQIYNRKLTTEEPVPPPEGISSEVRKRVSEIMSSTGMTKPQERPQDMMVTTYDVFPGPTSPTSDEDAVEREKFLQGLSPKADDGRESYPEGEEESQQEEGKTETYGQEWIDDDFGLSRTRREAEELRLQQLQIEQEIQQLQAQQEVPYFYLREIPNKPPPPYTPPGKPLAEIPTSESDVAAITLSAVRILAEEMAKGTRIADIEPTSGYYEDAASEHLRCYKLFLFDLAKHVISELIEQQESKQEALPWMRTREHLSRYRYRKVERTVEGLSEFVQRQMSVLFGFGKKVSKESLIVKWIKKKRDHVDEILVGESQEEEAQWTQYDEDQVTVKNEVTLAILDSLLEDTTQVINSIFKNKNKRKTGNDSFAREVGTAASG